MSHFTFYTSQHKIEYIRSMMFIGATTYPHYPLPIPIFQSVHPYGVG